MYLSDAVLAIHVGSDKRLTINELFDTYGKLYLYFSVIDCFTDDILAIQPAENDKIVKFTDYIFENYISPDAMSPPNI